MASRNCEQIPIFWIVAATILLTLVSPLLLAQPSVPGFVVENYADVDTPGFMSFSPTGLLFVGNNDNSSDVSIHRVGLGGAPVEDFGPALRDPDAVLVDTEGAISGTVGAVLVGGANAPGAPPPKGYLVAILPDESAVPLFGSPTSVFRNPSCMDLDSTGRFLFTDPRTGSEGFVFVSSGGVPTVLYDYGGPYPALALDPSDQIYTLDGTGQVIQIHSPSGMLIEGAFATHTSAITEMAFAPSGTDWGTDLYAVVGSTGELLRINGSGAVAVVGTGFNNPGGLTFGGHDGRLYISSLGDNRIYRVSTPGEPIFNPISGSSFQLIYAPEGINWYEARDAAEAMAFQGMTGHLATYASAEEENFVIGAFPEIQPNYVWLGASDEASEGDWRWLTGEPWDYVNWDSGEPNGGKYENCLDYSDGVTRWNDESCSRPIYYYLVEFSLTSQLVAIDVKPGNRQNVINPRSRGRFWVAVLSGDEFDALRVDPASVRLGAGSASPDKYRVRDSNYDGVADLLLRFRTPKVGIVCGDTGVELTGQTYDGVEIVGEDDLRTVGCKKPKPKKKRKKK